MAADKIYKRFQWQEVRKDETFSSYLHRKLLLAGFFLNGAPLNCDGSIFPRAPSKNAYFNSC